jgi:hypothetical protein
LPTAATCPPIANAAAAPGYDPGPRARAAVSAGAALDDPDAAVKSNVIVCTLDDPREAPIPSGG